MEPGQDSGGSLSAEAVHFPIEAAMMAANMAPGMNRSFLAEEWRNVIKRKCWYEAMDEAGDLVEEDVQVDIQGMTWTVTL